MAGNRGKKSQGFCASCGGYFALNKFSKLFRHLVDLDTGVKVICSGTGRFPSHILERNETIEFVPPVVEVIQYVTKEAVDLFSETIDRVLPVYSLDGYVIGRVSVKLDRVILLTERKKLKNAS